MNNDCFEELFHWLSFTDLRAISQTCKQLYQAAGLYFEHNFSSLNVHSEDDGISIFHHTLRIDRFSPFIRKLIIDDDIKKYKFAAANCKSLNDIHFRNNILTAAKIDCIKEILSKIEVLKIYGGCFDGNFYTEFLIFCPNLKQLEVNKFKIIGDSKNENDWLRQKYQKLEHFGLIDDSWF